MSLIVDDARVKLGWKTVEELEVGTIFEDYQYGKGEFYIKMYTDWPLLNKELVDDQFCICYSFNKNSVYKISKDRSVIPVKSTLTIENAEM